MKSKTLLQLLLVLAVTALLVSIGVVNFRERVNNEPASDPDTAPLTDQAPRPARQQHIEIPKLPASVGMFIPERNPASVMFLQEAAHGCGQEPYLSKAPGTPRGPCKEVTIECLPDGTSPCDAPACMSCLECKMAVRQSTCRRLGLSNGAKFPASAPPFKQPASVTYENVTDYCLAKHEIVHAGQDCGTTTPCSMEEEAYVEHAKCICEFAGKAKDPTNAVKLGIECCAVMGYTKHMGCQIDSGIDSSIENGADGKQCDCKGKACRTACADSVRECLKQTFPPPPDSPPGTKGPFDDAPLPDDTCKTADCRYCRPPPNDCAAPTPRPAADR